MALRHLLDQARTSQVNFSSLPDIVPATAALAAPVQIAVPPLIQIEPLTLPSGEGVRQ
jgi:hypothetical protein